MCTAPSKPQSFGIQGLRTHTTTQAHRCTHKQAHKNAVCKLLEEAGGVECECYGTDDFNITITVIIGSDRVVCWLCVFGLSSTQHLRDPTCRVGAPDVAAALTPAQAPTPDLYPALTAHVSTHTRGAHDKMMR